MKLNKIVGLTVATLLAAVGVGLSTQTNASAKSYSGYSYAETTRQIKSGKLRIPAKTRVYLFAPTTKNHKVYAKIDVGDLNYNIRHTSKNAEMIVPYSGNLKVLKGNYPRPVTIAKGKQFTTQSNFIKAPKIAITSNNYVEYFANGNTGTKPTSSTKITATKQKGNLTHYYAKKNMLKLPDRHISKKGNYQYRLAVRLNKNHFSKLSTSYSVGTLKNYFYLPAPMA
ncbi:hypothetical protein HC026_07030 [Lactobacillus sp. LC28-10]|uniref:Cell surface protein n=2 Tax=Secundilactobacillus TaxID=2767892 RepID=A0A1Z5IWD2_9LACO|nr:MULTISPECIES: hypothetical protein [Secundilactobacillus]MCH5462952.1 hypothetical protein [Secundilactobacillus angelensis]NLR18677.1 hypothetical protein [Secundilactobacillus angelensis]GAX06075.1 hypothetical protein IWT25_01400 [Secundilactobacillus pentosiphilus]